MQISVLTGYTQRRQAKPRNELIKRPQGSFHSAQPTRLTRHTACTLRSAVLCIELGIVLSPRRRLCVCIPFDAANQYVVYHKISLHTCMCMCVYVPHVLRAVRLAKPTRQQRGRERERERETTPWWSIED